MISSSTPAGLYRTMPAAGAKTAPKFSGSLVGAALNDLGCLVGAGLLLAGGTVGLPLYGVHKGKEKVQFDHFKRTLEKQPEKINQQYKPGLEGDKALHERLRWLIASGDTRLLHKALEQDRVRTLDLNEGEHIRGKKSAITKALTRLDSPKKADQQERILQMLAQHPKYNPNRKETDLVTWRFGPTLLTWAVRNKKSNLTNTILQNENLKRSTVEDAKSSLFFNPEEVEKLNNWLRRN